MNVIGSACGAVEASCVCSLPSGHEDAFHQCDCGGEWRYDENGEFKIKTLPGVFGSSQFAELVASLAAGEDQP